MYYKLGLLFVVLLAVQLAGAISTTETREVLLTKTSVVSVQDQISEWHCELEVVQLSVGVISVVGRKPVLWKICSVTREFPFGKPFDGRHLSKLPVDDMELIEEGMSVKWLLVAFVERSLLSALIVLLCYRYMSTRTASS